MCTNYATDTSNVCVYVCAFCQLQDLCLSSQLVLATTRYTYFPVVNGFKILATPHYFDHFLYCLWYSTSERLNLFLMGLITLYTPLAFRAFIPLLCYNIYFYYPATTALLCYWPIYICTHFTVAWLHSTLENHILHCVM